jgi:predicted amidophosphoribosyltransferase
MASVVLQQVSEPGQTDWQRAARPGRAGELSWLPCASELRRVDCALSCWGQLELVSAPVCDVYGTPMSHDAGPGAVSARAVEAPPGWHQARGAVVFNDASQSLIHALKYRDSHEVVRQRWRA